MFKLERTYCIHKNRCRYTNVEDTTIEIQMGRDRDRHVNMCVQICACVNGYTVEDTEI